jgi:hypothetical protein
MKKEKSPGNVNMQSKHQRRELQSTFERKHNTNPENTNHKPHKSSIKAVVGNRVKKAETILITSHFSTSIP